MTTDGWDEDYRRRGRLYRGEVRLPPILPGERVLELGCGDGRTLRALEARACTAVGVDSARSALALCRAGAREPAPEIALADARSLPFRDGSFDRVLMLHVIGHLRRADRHRLAAEAVRVTAPGGTVHLRVFSHEDLRAGAGDEVEEGSRLRRNGLLTHYFSENEAAMLFPSLVPDRLETVRWHLRIRGERLLRAEVEAVFRRPACLESSCPPFDSEKNHNT